MLVFLYARKPEMQYILSVIISVSKSTFKGFYDTLTKSHLKGFECYLIHADNPTFRIRGVFLNPNTRVGYSRAAYEKVHPRETWLSLLQICIGMWKNRLARSFTTPWLKSAQPRSEMGVETACSPP